GVTGLVHGVCRLGFQPDRSGWKPNLRGTAGRGGLTAPRAAGYNTLCTTPPAAVSRTSVDGRRPRRSRLYLPPGPVLPGPVVLSPPPPPGRWPRPLGRRRTAPGRLGLPARRHSLHALPVARPLRRVLRTVRRDADPAQKCG